MDAGHTYVGLGEPVARRVGESEACPDAEWIDQRSAVGGVIEFAKGGLLETTNDASPTRRTRKSVQ